MYLFAIAVFLLTYAVIVSEKVHRTVVYQDKLPGITLIKLPELFPITTSN